MQHRAGWRIAATAAAALIVTSFLPAPALAAPRTTATDSGSKPSQPPAATKSTDARTDIHHDTSPPLRDLAGQGPAPATGPPKEQPRHDPPRGQSPDAADPVVQTATPAAAMPSTTNNFEGTGNVNGVLPPDTVGDIGPGHYVQAVNLSLQIWDITSTPSSVLGPVATNTLWSGFGGLCQTTNDGDPEVVYDQFADRWVISQFALGASGPYDQCVAVSTTPDPTGSYYRYAFELSTTDLNDYPKLGVWRDGYYLSFNMFNGNTFTGVVVAALERDQMLAGLPARMVTKSTTASYWSLLPADADGLNPPPLGAPGVFARVDETSGNRLQFWKFHVDWANPANSTFTGPTNVATAAFDANMCNGSRNCIPQPGGKKVDAIADRLMNRLAYRNFGDHEALAVNHTVDTGTDHAGIRWYEVRNVTSGTTSINQQSTYSPDAAHRWMGSMAMDGRGNMALGYSVSSTSVSPSIRYTGRLSTDTINVLQAETSLVAGSGYQQHSSGRWGDYSSMNVAPDDCTFWYTQEYYNSVSSAGWQTRVGSFAFPSCTPTARGALHGTVTATGSATPIQGARVDVDGHTTFTDASGDYSFAALPPGTYDLATSANGYESKTVTGVAVTDGGSTTLDVSLQPLPMVAVTGTVTDGSGHGWPLYARVDSTSSATPAFTDPATGAYSMLVPEGATPTFTVSAVGTGYDPATRTFTAPAGGTTQDFALGVAASCDAPGYGGATTFVTQGFGGGGTTPPAGWTTTSVYSNLSTWWRFDDPKGRGNLTGGSGGFAIVDSDYAGRTRSEDTQLVSPAFDASGSGRVSLGFKNYFRHFSDEIADVDVSVNGGSTWTAVWRRQGVDDSAPADIDISSVAAGQSNVKVRWHYYNATYEWYWEVDDVVISGCNLTPGGLVLGTVTDANTAGGVVGATVSDSLGQATTIATPDDPNVGDGFYQLVAPPGTPTLTAGRPRYISVGHTPTVTAGTVTTQGFALPAGQLGATLDGPPVVLAPGASTTRNLTITNTGGRAANFWLREVNAPPPAAPQPTGPFADAVRHTSPKNLNAPSAAGLYTYTPPEPAPYAAGDVTGGFASGLSGVYGVGYDTDTDNVWVGSVAANGGDDTDHRFGPDGTATGDTIAADFGGSFAADLAYNPLTRTLWQVSVGAGDCIHELDPATTAATGNTICPAVANSQRGLAFDPVSDTYYSGSWLDGVVNHFAPDGTILDSVDVGLAISGLAYNPATKHLFVMTNSTSSATVHDAYVLDASTTAYTPLGSFDVAGLADNQQAGLSHDCSGKLWATNQSDGQVVGFDSGETGWCDALDVAWLSESPTGGTVPAGGSTTVSVTFDATGLVAGTTYTARIDVSGDTPYGPVSRAAEIEVSSTLTPQQAPQGSWRSSRGSGGATLFGWNGASDDVLGGVATVAVTRGARYQWAASTGDVRALEGTTTTARRAGTVYDPTRVDVQVQFNAAFNGPMYLYALDWDGSARRESVTITAGSSTWVADLDTTFHDGAWLAVPLDVAAGSTVTVTVTRTAGVNAVLSGILFGDTGIT